MREDQTIILQRSQIKKGNPLLSLDRPCGLGDGIIRFTEAEKKAFEVYFEQTERSCCYFVPASGSGSRMFDFLYDYLEIQSEQNRERLELFLANVRDFAFFQKLPEELQRAVLDSSIDKVQLIRYLLSDTGMNFGNIPKGLIPFHHMPPFVLNPFQEHVLQGLKITSEMRFHFTIQPNFRRQIIESIKQVAQIVTKTVDLNFSVQDPKTDAYVFDELLVLEKDNRGETIRLPAGHGALLGNLQTIQEDLIFVKNIDNVQPYRNSEKSTRYFKALAGLLLQVKQELKDALDTQNLTRIKSLSKKYFLFTEGEFSAHEGDLNKLIHRPIRVCGMVKNQGQPGGGPYYVDIGGILKKQIVERVQIASDHHNSKLMLSSTHFNPVFMVLDIHGSDGQKFDLSEFRNEEHYFVVEKSQKGKTVSFVEYPGLWNGSMENWITLFVEIPNEIFSPVKTVLDLLESAHQ
ncbi:MAG: DUF4301 family protein [Bacteroidetes bacterium]|nr:DUF4301 family protein [Bacteroidota bacterium]